MCNANNPYFGGLVLPAFTAGCLSGMAAFFYSPARRPGNPFSLFSFLPSRGGESLPLSNMRWPSVFPLRPFACHAAPVGIFLLFLSIIERFFCDPVSFSPPEPVANWASHAGVHPQSFLVVFSPPAEIIFFHPGIILYYIFAFTPPAFSPASPTLQLPNVLSIVSCSSLLSAVSTVMSVDISPFFFVLQGKRFPGL